VVQWGIAYAAGAWGFLQGLQYVSEAFGWPGPYWSYARDFDPSLASIRKEPEFKAVFADIERDMARQRAELAARSKDAPLDLGAVH